MFHKPFQDCHLSLARCGTPWAGAEDYDGMAIERGIAAENSTYPELVPSDRSSFWSWLARRAASEARTFIV